MDSKQLNAVELPEIDKPIKFRTKPGELSFGGRDIPHDSVHQGCYDGRQWLSENLVGEIIGRVKMYHTNQIDIWWYC